MEKIQFQLIFVIFGVFTVSRNCNEMQSLENRGSVKSINTNIIFEVGKNYKFL